MPRNHTAAYLRPDTPCGRCDRPLIEHLIGYMPAPDGLEPGDFGDVDLRAVYCPKES